MARFVLVVVLFAAAVYALMWALERRRASRAPARPASEPDRRTVAPDDDEEFLRRLDRQRREERPDPQDGDTAG